MIDGTPWRVTDEGADAVDAAVIVDNNGGEVLGVSEWARIDDKPLADIVRAVNAHDALVAALEFYANAWNDGDWTFGTWKLKADQDGGDNARAALALARGGKDEDV